MDKRNLLSIIGVIGAGLLAVATVDTDTNSTPSKPPVPFSERDDSIMARMMSEDFVKKILKAPSTAKFPGIFSGSPPARVVKIGPQKYTIYSWVDSHNTFGAMIRSRYIITLEQTSPGNWNASEFTFDGQKMY